MRGASSLICLSLSLGALAGCSREPTQMAAPLRVDTAPPVVQQPSQIDVPITARITALEQALNAKVPRTLWTIDEIKPKCVPGQRIFKMKLKVTPDLSCRLVGQAVRGHITVGGAGQKLTLTMPVSAEIAARNIGKILKGETATAAARVTATARLGMTRSWQPTAKIDIDYQWTELPGVDLLGQRVKFASKVDPRLQKVIARLEQSLAQEMSQLDARSEAEKAWRQGFVSLELNHKNPPVWLRVTPERIAYGGYTVVGNEIRLALNATALTETFVGPRPEPRTPTPLPPLSFDVRRGNTRLFVPVIASYAELEPVLSKALGKLARKGIVIPSVGQVAVRFGKVTIYGTAGGRIAVGIEIHAQDPAGLLRPNGTVWLTGVPVNAPGSQAVGVRDLAIGASTDSPATNLLAKIALSADIRGAIQSALTENFARDYDKVLGKANAALKAKRTGDFLLSAVLTNVRNGQISAYGQGLYMPVTATGAATLRYQP